MTFFFFFFYASKIYASKINKIFCYFCMCFECENRWIQVQIAIFSYFRKILGFWDAQKNIFFFFPRVVCVFLVRESNPGRQGENLVSWPSRLTRNIYTLLTGFEPATSGLEVQCAIHCATRAYNIYILTHTHCGDRTHDRVIKYFICVMSWSYREQPFELYLHKLECSTWSAEIYIYI